MGFDALHCLEYVDSYYAGGSGSDGTGTGPNYGVTFSSNAEALADRVIQSTCGSTTSNVTNEPSPQNSVIFLSGSAATMNVPAGFTSGFSFYYAAPEDPGYISVWSGLNGTGTLLASLNLPLTGGCSSEPAVLMIGDLKLACAVLDDEETTRVFTQEGFLTAIGRAGKAKGGEGASIDGRPAFLRAKNLEPFISTELLASTTPLEFIPEKGPGYQGRAFGYRASLLPGVCWVYQDALTANKLVSSREHIGQQCRLLLKALTNFAIEDLIDRATGFDALRKRKAVLKIIEQYVRKDALPWVKLFDVEFYRQIYRLNHWPFDPEKTARPGVIGHWTNDIYDRLAPGVRPALHGRVKRNAQGRPKQKLTQYLTPEEGKPRLKEILEGVKALMRVSTNWDDFEVKLDMVYPNFNTTLQLPFDEAMPALPRPSLGHADTEERPTAS
jgi:hypothetical protein